MLLKYFLFFSMLIQLGAAIASISLIRRTRFNISWILISAGFVLMAFRRLFEFSTLFWETQLISEEDVNSWIGILVSILMLVGVIFIRKIFNLQDQIEEIRKESEAWILKAVIQTEEKARQSFARELHDGLGPVLSSIKMTTSAIELETMKTSNRKLVERICKATDEALITLEEISNDLSPHLLKNYGLIKALQTSANQLLANTNIRLELNENIRSKRYNYDLEINVFRIVSELLNNSIKHGAPDKIILRIHETENHLQIEYQDNGIGFEIKENTKGFNKQGMGLENINSRIKSLNGNYKMESKPGKGVSIFINIPTR